MARTWLALAAAPVSIAMTASASAQDLDSGLVIQPAIPQDFNRGRNISVAEQPRPDYNAVGLNLGGFKLYPRVEAGAGTTSNTYLVRDDENSSVFLYQQGSARLNSQWSRHALQLSGSTTQREYLGESRRNEDLWSLAASGRLDLQSSFKVDASVNVSRQLQGLFSGEASSTVAALSLYRRDYGMLKGTYTQGRIRAFATVDQANFQFSPVELSSGERVDQSFRDRRITRLTAQVEYARSPSVALFTQASATRIRYDERPEAGLEKLGSKSFRVLGGINVDIAGQVRGTVGLGYNVRNYDAAIYKTVSGLAGEVQLQAFPTPRLTFEFNGIRLIEDRTAGAVRPSIVTRTSLSVDYELLRNMIISASGGYINQRRTGDTYRATASGRYLISRRMSIQSTASFSQRVSSSVSELRLEAGLAYQL
jgi:hypothetical protein